MSSINKIRILLVDDHIVLRMGLVTATSGEEDMEVVGEAENGVAAIKAYQELKPDVIVMDLRMPTKGGMETIRDLRTLDSQVRILVFSNYASGDEIMQAFEAGVKGFVVKDMPLDNLLEGIREIHNGNQYIPAEVSIRISRRVISQLTPRELEVLELIGKGNSNKEIASHLNLVEGTVKVHVTSILSKLDVSDRTQAILSAVKRGIINIE